jgi:hypothetical protein
MFIPDISMLALGGADLNLGDDAVMGICIPAMSGAGAV